MIYVILILTIAAIVAGFLAYLSIKRNISLKKELDDAQKRLSTETSLRKKIEEANTAYAEKLATLINGPDIDRFNAAVAIMSNGAVPPIKPAPKP